MASTPRSSPLLLLALVASLVVSATTWGQYPTGILIGNVVNVQGDVLSGVTVTARSPNLQGARTAVTGVNGRYKLAFLPAGIYDITYELGGFRSAVREVRIAAAQTKTSDIQLHELTVVEESIVVTSSLETIPEANTAATTYSHDEVEQLPVLRSPTEAALLTPGVAATGVRTGTATRGRVTIAGGRSGSNLWLVNGVVVNNLNRSPLYIEDAVQETTTLVSGVAAEYGRFTGGVVNALTRSGGNEFSGSLRVSFTNDEWRAKTPISGDRVDELDQIYEATLGGFFWRDHLWFFTAGRDLDLKGSDQTLLTGHTFETSNTETRLEAKLTVSFTPNHNLIASYLEIDEKTANTQFSGNIDIHGLTDREDPQKIQSLNYTGILTPTLFLEAQYSERRWDLHKGAGAKSRTLTEGTLMRWRNTLYRYYTPTFCGVCEEDYEESRNALIKVSYFLSSERAGTHDLVAGYDLFEDIYYGINHQTGSDFTVWASDTIVQSASEIYPQFLGTSTWIGWWAVFNPELLQPSTTTTGSFYLNDRWQLNEHLAFNIGLRYDKNTSENAAGVKTADDSKLSPRLGLSWDVKGDGDLTVNASYGTYVLGNVGAGMANTTAGAIGLYLSAYGGPLINTDAGCVTTGTCTGTREALEVLFDWYLSNGGTTDVNGDLSSIPGLFYTSLPHLTWTIPETLRSPAADELALGFAKRLGTKGTIRADLVYRQWTDIYSLSTTPDFQKVETSAGPMDLQWLVNAPDNLLDREYWGLHSQGRYRFTDRLTLAGVYTLSYLRGNMAAETVLGIVGTGYDEWAPKSWPEYKDPRWNFSSGYLEADQRHRLRAWAIYEIIDTQHHSLTVSWLENFWSGSPYGSHGGVNSKPFVENPGYASPPAWVSYWYEPRDTYKTDDVHRSDLSLNYAFRWELWKTPMEVFIQPEILNLFNESAVTQVNQIIVDASSGGKCGSGPCEPFNPFTETPVEDVHWRKGDNFGQPDAEWDYQVPRTFRFSVGFRF